MRRLLTVLLALLAAASAPAPGASASDCAATSVGFTPLLDLGTGTYLGFEGGLYPGGSSVPPAAHLAAALAAAGAVERLDASGAPDPGGRYVLLSIGMSNTVQEFRPFVELAAVHPDVDHDGLVIANGARGGQSAQLWDAPDEPNYDRVRDTVLADLGVTEAQVQAVWIKQALPAPTISLADDPPSSDAVTLQAILGDVVRAVRTRYPNIRLAFLSSRIYAGYADSPLNPEPFAYETGFSARWLISAQIGQQAGLGIDGVSGDLDPATAAPLLAWGPYLWADGLVPRSDGLVWICTDLESDGTHPSTSGEEKVAGLLLDFMLESPLARPWFRADGGAGLLDADSDGLADAADLCPLYPSSNADADGNGIGDECECGDQSGDGLVNVADLLAINAAIFDPTLVTPLCDTNDDGVCDVGDILGANARIFGAEAFCSRRPAL